MRVVVSEWRGERPAVVEPEECYSTVDASGTLIVALPERDRPVRNVFNVADDVHAPLGAHRRRVANRLGCTHDRRPRRAHPLHDRNWNELTDLGGLLMARLMPTLRPTRGRLEVWLDNQLIDRYTVFSGGAVSTDNFDRANGALGAAWTNVAGTIEVSSNQARQTAGDGSGNAYARYETDCGSVDMYSQMTTPSNLSGFGQVNYATTCVRWASGGGDFYFGGFWDYTGSTDRMGVGRRLSGTLSYLTDVTSGFSAFTSVRTIRCEIEGSTLRVLQDGVLVSSTTDSNITTDQRGGMLLHDNNAFSLVYDNYEQGNLAGALSNPFRERQNRSPIYRM